MSALVSPRSSVSLKACNLSETWSTLEGEIDATRVIDAPSVAQVPGGEEFIRALKSEREYWCRTCLRNSKAVEQAALEKVKGMEQATLEKVEESVRHWVDQAASKLHGELSRSLQQEVEVGRAECETAVFQLQRDQNLDFAAAMQNIHQEVDNKIAKISAIEATIEDLQRSLLVERNARHDLHSLVQDQRQEICLLWERLGKQKKTMHGSNQFQDVDTSWADTDEGQRPRDIDATREYSCVPTSQSRSAKVASLPTILPEVSEEWAASASEIGPSRLHAVESSCMSLADSTSSATVALEEGSQPPPTVANVSPASPAAGRPTSSGLPKLLGHCAAQPRILRPKPPPNRHRPLPAYTSLERVQDKHFTGEAVGVSDSLKKNLEGIVSAVQRTLGSMEASPVIHSARDSELRMCAGTPPSQGAVAPLRQPSGAQLLERASSPPVPQSSSLVSAHGASALCPAQVSSLSLPSGGLSSPRRAQWPPMSGGSVVVLKGGQVTPGSQPVLHR